MANNMGSENKTVALPTLAEVPRNSSSEPMVTDVEHKDAHAPAQPTEMVFQVHMGFHRQQKWPTLSITLRQDQFILKEVSTLVERVHGTCPPGLRREYLIAERVTKEEVDDVRAGGGEEVKDRIRAAHEIIVCLVNAANQYVDDDGHVLDILREPLSAD